MNFFKLLLLLFLLFGCVNNFNKPLSALEKLKSGNKRFAEGSPIHPDETLERLRELKQGQHPFAIIVSCSDSRVPPELIFDQGFGDIFSVRTAGNIIGDYELGSIEYAVEHLHCKFILVLGHKDCGAIKSFVESKGCYEHFDHIKTIIDYISNEEEEIELLQSNVLNLDRAIDANVQHGVKLLKASEPILKHLVDNNEVSVMGGYYDLETGIVNFYSED